MHSLLKSISDSLLSAGSFQPEELSITGEKLLASESRDILLEFLDNAHLSEISQAVTEKNLVEPWLKLITKAINATHYSVGDLIHQRIERYGDKPFLQTITGSQLQSYSYREIGDRIHGIQKSLLAYQNQDAPLTVGIFSTNRLESACMDLACLSAGIRVIPIPANSSPAQLAYILNHAKIQLVFAGGAGIIASLREARLSGQQAWVTFPDTPELPFRSQSWAEFLEQQADTLVNPVPTDPNLATILYTSGTTSDPKGIVFSQSGMLVKRFARALALPEISSEDSFLAYLPLYHTFGRFFELMGTLFWGATYTFAESPAFNTLLAEFPVVRPTVLISIPKRWMQIFEHVRNGCSFEVNDDEAIKQFVHKLTGNRLKWGLSAAGYLDPDIFMFFQKHGIYLLSGYGMTEATGGITMTPPNDYVRNSVGIPLPAMDAKLAEDGELCIRGPYVCTQYFGDPLQDTHQDGWFHSGDIFEEKSGHYFIIDRKKEIYKNSRGQTISPQKIENLFQDFKPIQRVFLVGDGLEFNTVLIYPNPDYELPDEIAGDEAKTRDFFSSLVQSVNSFLASYERIVNFTLIDRDFTEESGELTKKGTYKRKVILEHFKDVITPMYTRNYQSLVHGNFELRLPDWIIRDRGVTRQEMHWNGKTLLFQEHELTVSIAENSREVKIGDFDYEFKGTVIDLQNLMTAPELWAGNCEWTAFLDSALMRLHLHEPVASLTLLESKLPFGSRKDQKTRTASTFFAKLNQLADRQLSESTSTIQDAIDELKSYLSKKAPEHNRIVIAILLRCRFHPDLKIREAAFNSALPFLNGSEFLSGLLDSLTIANNRNLPQVDVSKMAAEHFHALLSYLESVRSLPQGVTSESHPELDAILHLIGRYGRIHPGTFRWIRAELTWWQMVFTEEPIRKVATHELSLLTDQFRKWIGQPKKVAIDPESGEEFTWQDVVLFDDNIDNKTQELLLNLFSKTPAIAEAIFLFGGKRVIRLEDIAPKGIWISSLGTSFQKSVFRVLVQTHSTEAYNLVINVNLGLTADYLEEETCWLILLGSSLHGSRLVEMFGGYWSEYQIYTEEYIPGDTVRQHLDMNREEIASGSNPDRWRMRWLHFIWNGTMAYVEFWRRSGFKLGFKEPSTQNLIIPIYDYTSGTRLISISNRTPLKSLLDLLVRIYHKFIVKSEKEYQGLQRMADWEILLTAVTQKLTVKGAFLQFEILLENWDFRPEAEAAEELGLSAKRLRQFMADVKSEGVLTKPVVFASLRYERWLNLNPDATREARGSLLKELYNDYHLASLLEDYPESRIRFFLMTCFRNSPEPLRRELYQLQKKLRSHAISLEELDIYLSRIQQDTSISEDDQYFLSRLLFEHLDSTEQGELITWDWGAQNRLDLITAVEDRSGNQYRIRPPFQPKEIAHFHGLLQASNFNPAFRQEHQFLLLFNSNQVVVGGVYWKPTSINTAYIERIVISHRYRKLHLSTRLLEELFNRLRDRSYQYVTVGFFQAGLFYKVGFTVNKEFGGLVKPL